MVQLTDTNLTQTLSKFQKLPINPSLILKRVAAQLTDISQKIAKKGCLLIRPSTVKTK